MMMPKSANHMLFLFILLVALTPSFAQEPTPSSAPEKKSPVFVPPSVRLKEAKSVFLKNAGGSEIPFNVIEGGIEGWGRYVLAESPEKADLIVEVTSPSEESGVSVTSKTTTGDGPPQQSTTSTRELGTGPIKLVVYDARNHVPLWSASEQPKGAFKQKNREDKLVEAAQKLVHAFRERVEPQVAQ
jgi:hypothetical protein